MIFQRGITDPWGSILQAGVTFDAMRSNEDREGM